jgi:hypothetical protein
MSAISRGWIIWTIILGSIGAFLLLWGFGVDVGRWWPILVSAFGLASLARGMDRRENRVLGLLLVGWGGIGVLAFHHDLLGIVSILPFLIGALIIWIPVAILLSKIGLQGTVSE